MIFVINKVVYTNNIIYYLAVVNNMYVLIVKNRPMLISLLIFMICEIKVHYCTCPIIELSLNTVTRMENEQIVLGRNEVFFLTMNGHVLNIVAVVTNTNIHYQT